VPADTGAADLVLRMAVATVAGAALGWERSRQNRAIMGLRTLSLVGLASCIAVLAIVHSGLPQLNADAAGRVVQGVLSGVGFIGAGALLHGGGDGKQVHGLATAASIWVSAAMGAAAALAVWPLIGGGVGLGLLVLLVGAPLERRIRDRARGTPAEADRRDMEARP
jgi:putative Mg2+ transporter-C (MgtC) family protein